MSDTSPFDRRTERWLAQLPTIKAEKKKCGPKQGTPRTRRATPPPKPTTLGPRQRLLLSKLTSAWMTRAAVAAAVGENPYMAWDIAVRLARRGLAEIRDGAVRGVALETTAKTIARGEGRR